MKYLLITAMLLVTLNLRAQTCTCEKEFLYVKNIVENGFAGFPDNVRKLTEAGYKKKVDELLKLTTNKFASDNCILIISQYLDLFKSYHLGMIKNEGKLSGDWLREGATVKQETGQVAADRKSSPAIDARSLSPNTFYIKMASFGRLAKRPIDSILKANASLLSTTPNLVLDIRGNGGGGDDCWEPFIPYLYTNPIRMIGADALASETTIGIFKKRLENKDLSKEEIAYYNNKLALMEKAKGQWVVNNADEIDSAFTEKAFPKKIIIIVNNECGSSAEEFLLAARQSSKVSLVGENSIGNLDYSNIITTPFSCYPYTLQYPITRSRRLDLGQGIDNVGIAPKIYLPKGKDWLEEALKIAERP